MEPDVKENAARLRLAIVATHPIQYQTPLWHRLAQCPMLEVMVFYATSHGSVDTFDPLYGRSFSWDVPLLEGYEYEFMKSMRIPGLPGPTACYYPAGLGRKFAEGKFDAVLIHGYMNGASWAGYLAARRCGLPILLRGDSHLVGRKLTGLRARVKTMVLRHFLHHISCFLAIGDWNFQYWIHYGVPEHKIRKSLFAVDNARFREAKQHGGAEINRLRNTWGVRPEDIVFVFSGNLQSHKGVDVLIRAFIELSTHRTDVHLVIIGQGPAETELKELAGAADRIHWPGFVNQSGMPLHLAAADIFVLPSYVEPWGLVVNEAMACGLPCIVSDVVGAGPSLVSGPNTGLIFPAGDASALCSSLVNACDPDIRAVWSANIPEIMALASYDDNVSVIANCVRDSCNRKHDETS